MNYQIILLLVSLTIFVSYLILIISRFGILPSISDSYYQLPQNQKILFTLALWGFAMPIIFLSENGLFFFSGSGICFVGAAPLFKDKDQSLIHRIGAIVGILLGLLALILVYHEYYVAIGYLISAPIIYFTAKNRIWWVEILSFLTILSGLMLYFCK